MENGKSQKLGLVLEGGAMRGMYTAGVLDVFMENRITVDGMIGVSAGAVFGCNYKSGQIGRTIRYNKRFCNDKRYCSIRSLIFTGNIFNEKFCYHTVPETLDIFDQKSFEENPMEFYVVATDTKTGEPIYKKCEKGDAYDLEWFRASASMPMVSRPVKIDGKTYLDGGISDSIPLDYFRSIGYGKNIVVLTQPESYRKKKSSILPLAKLMLIGHKGAYLDMKRRHTTYNSFLDSLAERKAAGDTLIIQPKEKLGIAHAEKNPDELERVYQLGRADALERLDEIREFIKG